jgi:hypothetical protein
VRAPPRRSCGGRRGSVGGGPAALHRVDAPLRDMSAGGLGFGAGTLAVPSLGRVNGRLVATGRPRCKTDVWLPL